jgi:uncharacterized BrkB/YihY/UPF0761 family membrane protein
MKYFVHNFNFFIINTLNQSFNNFFVFGGVGLFGFATIYELVTRKMVNKKHRIAVGVAIVIAIMMVVGWAATGPD